MRIWWCPLAWLARHYNEWIRGSNQAIVPILIIIIIIFINFYHCYVTARYPYYKVPGAVPTRFFILYDHHLKVIINYEASVDVIAGGYCDHPSDASTASAYASLHSSAASSYRLWSNDLLQHRKQKLCCHEVIDDELYYWIQIIIIIIIDTCNKKDDDDDDYDTE